ncbi:MAG: NAD(P)/FAD-dependent oxidoreductase [Chloroflexi bacterium]|nr:NAD(P)/FAD-dependent oxidoreductase [Chloroflexota bacterium]
MKSDVVIIGGGIAGLATGTLLAKQGLRAVVLEKGNQPGGRAYTYEEQGFTLNYGPHAMYTPESGILAEVMGRLGRTAPPCGYVDPMRAYWADGDRLAVIGAKPHQLLTTKLFSLGERVQMVKFMLAIRSAKTEAIPPGTTWREWTERQTGDAAVRRFANALGTVNSYTRPAADLDAAWLIAHFQRALFAKDSVGYMAGGFSAMYDIFIDELRANGGTLVTGRRVERVEVDGGRIAAAITADERYEAGAFVCTLPPQEAPAIAPAGSALHAEMLQWATLDDVRALCVDLGFSRKVRDGLALVFDIERDLYYSVHSYTTPGLAPASGQLLHAMAYLSSEEGADATQLQRRKDELLAGLDLHFPGWHEAIAVERTLPAVRVTGARQTPENRKRLVPLRASAASNLYFAGDARDLPYNLTQIVLASAMEVASAIVSTPAAAPVAAGAL